LGLSVELLSKQRQTFFWALAVKSTNLAIGLLITPVKKLDTCLFLTTIRPTNKLTDYYNISKLKLKELALTTQTVLSQPTINVTGF